MELVGATPFPSGFRENRPPVPWKRGSCGVGGFFLKEMLMTIPKLPSILDKIYIEAFDPRMNPEQFAELIKFAREVRVSMIPPPPVLALDVQQKERKPEELEKALEALKKSEKEVLEKAEKEAVAYLKKQHERIDEVFGRVFSHLHGLLYEAIVAVLATLRSGLPYEGDAASEMRGFIEVLNGLNVSGQAEIDKVLDFLDDQVRQPCAERSQGEITLVLAQCVQAVRSTTICLLQEEREEREEDCL